MSKDSAYDVIVLGTGMVECIVAAALSKAGWKVAHIDPNPFYGNTEASLTAEETVRYLQERSNSVKDVHPSVSFSSVSHSSLCPPNARSYSLSLAPSMIPSEGPFIASLVSSGVARYSYFKLLERVLLCSNGRVKQVPGSKEDIFKSKDLTLIDKRKLMRVLMFAAGEFENSPELEGRQERPFAQFLEEVFTLDVSLSAELCYALAFCVRREDTTLAALTRTRQYLRSAGRYGSSPFLVGHYGGLGELAQGFCRVCAVAGGTYILSRRILSIDVSDDEASESTDCVYRISLEDVPDALSASLVISSVDCLPRLLPTIRRTSSNTTETSVGSCSTVARGIAIVSGPVTLAHTACPQAREHDSTREEGESTSAGQQCGEEVDTAVLVFTPGQVADGEAEGAVHIIINGAGTMSCPKSKTILYLSTSLRPTDDVGEAVPSAEALLRPYLSATLSLLSASHQGLREAHFACFYHQSTESTSQTFRSSLLPKGVILTNPLPLHFATVSDAAATGAESIFWEAVHRLGVPRTGEPVEAFWPPLNVDTEEDEIE